MKQIFALLFISFLALDTLDAQKLSVGGQFDLNLSSITGDGFSGKLKSGFNAGAFVLIKISPKLSIEPVLEFSQQTVRTTSDFTDYYSRARASADSKDVILSYVNLAALVNYKLSRTITLKAGPQYGYLLNVSRNLLRNDAESLEKYDLGLLTAASINPTERLQFSLKYYWGFMDLNKIVNYRHWYKRQLSFGISYVLFKK